MVTALERRRNQGDNMAEQPALVLGPGRPYLATREERHAACDRAWERVVVAKAHTAWLVARSSTLLAASQRCLAAAEHPAGMEAVTRRYPVPPRQPGADWEHCSAATLEATAALPRDRPAPPVPHREAMGPDLTEPLTVRECEVLALLPRRLTNKEIAGTLCVSWQTVAKHTANIYQKLRVTGRREAVSRATTLQILAAADDTDLDA